MTNTNHVDSQGFFRNLGSLLPGGRWRWRPLPAPKAGVPDLRSTVEPPASEPIPWSQRLPTSGTSDEHIHGHPVRQARMIPLGVPEKRQPSPAASPSQLTRPPEPRPQAPVQRLLVQWAAGTRADDRAAALAHVGGRGLDTIHTRAMESRGDGVMEIVGLADDGSLVKALAFYATCPGVRFVEPDRRLGLAAVSDDPLFTAGSLWGMSGSNATGAWAAGHTGSPSICIGIVDQGVDFSHPDLIANAWVNPYDPVDGIDNDGNGYIDDVNGWDFVSNDNSVFDAGTDQHGTHVAGTIGASGGNALGVAGVSWAVSLIAAKFLGADGGTTADAVRAIDYLTDLKLRHGIRLVASNNSWGGGGASQALADAIARAARADILFIAAAGNNAGDNDVSPTYPASFSTIATAGYEAVVSVASITDSGALSSFSNAGLTSVDLGAPGSGILSTLPGDGYGVYSGTSMATPHVTGAVALYAASHPDATAEEIRTALLQSTTPTAALAGRTVTGGRLDVARMLDTVVPTSLALSPIAAVQAEGNSGSTSFTFSVTRSGATGTASSVAWAVTTPTAGGATADDFAHGVLPSGNLLFAPGERRKTISVAIAVDSLYERCEDFVLGLSDPSPGSVLTTATALGTILNDDALVEAGTTGPVSIPSQGAAAGAALILAGLNGVIDGLTVTLADLSHSWPDDLDVLLVGPSGAAAVLMSDAGGSVGISGLNLTFSGRAATPMADHGPLTSGTFVPTDWEAGDPWPAPWGAPSARLGVFDGTDPNGTWTLQIVDDNAGDSGLLAGGWSLAFSLAPSSLALEQPALNDPREGNAGANRLSFVVNRRGDLSAPCSVAWAVQGSGPNPVDGADFVGDVLPEGTLAFAPGESSRFIEVAVKGDGDPEADEGFSVTLLQADGTLVAADGGMVTVTLRDDDSRTDWLPPVLNHLTVDGNQLWLDFNEAIRSEGLSPALFSARVAGTRRSITAVSSGTDPLRLSLTLGGAAPTAGQTVELLYTDPSAADDATGVVQDLAGNDLASISGSGRRPDGFRSPVNVTTLAPDTINLVLTGTAVSGYGNSGNNRIGVEQPTPIANVINGGDGLDSLDGGNGGDVYLVTAGSHHRGSEVQDSGAIGSDELRFASTLSGDTLVVFVDDTGLEVVTTGTGAGATASLTGTTALSVDASAAPNGLTLIGNNGANTLMGSAFGDRLCGRGGNDVLTGGDGDDSFRFETALNSLSNRDTITDFHPDEGDRIELENAIFSKLTLTGPLAAEAFAVAASASTAAQRILYDPGSGTLTYDSNGNGAGGSVVFAQIGTGLDASLRADCFLVT